MQGLHRAKDTSVPHMTSKEVDDAEGDGSGHSRDSWPPDHRDIPDHMALKKLEEKEGKFKMMVLVFPSHYYTQWSPALVAIAAHGKWGMNTLFCFAFVASAFPIKLSWSQLSSFLAFTLSILSPIPQDCVGPSCQLILNQNRSMCYLHAILGRISLKKVSVPIPVSYSIPHKIKSSLDIIL